MNFYDDVKFVDGVLKRLNQQKARGQTLSFLRALNDTCPQPLEKADKNEKILIPYSKGDKQNP